MFKIFLNLRIISMFLIFSIGSFMIIWNFFSKNETILNLSWIIGFILRIALIITGAIFQIFVLVAGLAVILFWLLIPFIILFGVLLIFS